MAVADRSPGTAGHLGDPHPRSSQHPRRRSACRSCAQHPRCACDRHVLPQRRRGAGGDHIALRTRRHRMDRRRRGHRLRRLTRGEERRPLRLVDGWGHRPADGLPRTQPPIRHLTGPRRTRRRLGERARRSGEEEPAADADRQTHARNDHTAVGTADHRPGDPARPRSYGLGDPRRRTRRARAAHPLR